MYLYRRLHACLDMYGGRVSIDNTLSCLYTPDVYMGSCVEIHEACRHVHITAIMPGANWSPFDRCMGHFSISNQLCLYTYYSEYATCKLPRHLHVPVYMYARKHKYICLYTIRSVSSLSLEHTRIYIYVNIYIYTYTHIYIYTYIHIYLCTYVHMYICTYVYVYVYTYIHTYIYIYT